MIKVECILCQDKTETSQLMSLIATCTYANANSYIIQCSPFIKPFCHFNKFIINKVFSTNKNNGSNEQLVSIIVVLTNEKVICLITSQSHNQQCFLFKFQYC